MSGLKETQNKWLSVVPISLPQCMPTIKIFPIAIPWSSIYIEKREKGDDAKKEWGGGGAQE